jgi:hypothetical protein
VTHLYLQQRRSRDRYFERLQRQRPDHLHGFLALFGAFVPSKIREAGLSLTMAIILTLQVAALSLIKFIGTLIYLSVTLCASSLCIELTRTDLTQN